MTYLVTGGCGFIGSHLVDLLVEGGHRVRVLDDLSNSTPNNFNPGAEYVFGSITDDKVVLKSLVGVKGIFHLAAKVSVPDSIVHWQKNNLVNCVATISLLEKAKKIPFIFASSAAVYGDAHELPHREEGLLKPLSPYAIDKMASEMHARLAWELHGTPSISFRFFNVYGPRQNPLSPYSGVISKFAASIMQGQPITFFGDGLQERDFIYVRDVASILKECMESPFEGAHVYNLCTGKTISILALEDLLGTLTRKSIKKEHAAPRQGDIRISFGDPSKLYHAKGLKAKTSLEEGLKLYLQNFKPYI